MLSGATGTSGKTHGYRAAALQGAAFAHMGVA